MRTFVSYPLRSELNDINHSGDDNPHKHHHNKYADKDNSYDPQAQIKIDEAKKRLG